MKLEQQPPHWLPCPICRERTDVKVYEDTVLFNFPLYCHHCKQETCIDMMQLRMARSSQKDEK